MWKPIQDADRYPSTLDNKGSLVWGKDTILEKDNPSDPNGLTVKFKKYEYYTTASCISTSDPKHKRRSCTLQKHEGKNPTTEHAQDNENQNTSRPDPKPDLQATEH